MHAERNAFLTCLARAEVFGVACVCQSSFLSPFRSPTTSTPSQRYCTRLVVHVRLRPSIPHLWQSPLKFWGRFRSPSCSLLECHLCRVRCSPQLQRGYGAILPRTMWQLQGTFSWGAWGSLHGYAPSDRSHNTLESERAGPRETRRTRGMLCGDSHGAGFCTAAHSRA